MDDTIIRAEQLTIGYDERPLMQNLNFVVRRGEVFVILGGSGSGKSTLLKHMIGLYPPLAGHIWVDGSDIATAEGAARDAVLRKIGVMYQSGALFGSMTLAQNVRLVLEEFTQLPEEAIDLIARMKLDLVGLRDFADHLPSEVSGGMQKRAAIARAMAMDPQILFLDEPSAGLDPVTSAELDALVIRLNQSLGHHLRRGHARARQHLRHRPARDHARCADQKHHRRRRAQGIARSQRDPRGAALLSPRDDERAACMKTNRSYFRLGVFILLAVAALISLVVVLGTGSLFRKDIVAETYFNESVQGLDVGSKVLFRGVLVGNLTKLSFTYVKYERDRPPNQRKPYVLVEFVVRPQLLGAADVARDELVRIIAGEVARGLRVREVPQGVTGLSFLELDYTDPKRNPPLAIDWEPQNLYVPSTRSTVGRIVSATEELVRRLESVDVEGFVTNVNHLAGTLAQKVDELDLGAISSETAGLIAMCAKPISGCRRYWRARPGRRHRATSPTPHATYRLPRAMQLWRRHVCAKFRSPSSFKRRSINCSAP
jgi:phospholipid/cholesterol/gamma-HCH transport system ATP-binding protein